LRELSLHILDIAENGITAGAGCMQIRVDENRRQDLLTLAVSDDGRGMPTAKLNNPGDPFITSRTNRRVGMGLSLLAAAAQRCGGRLEIETEAGRGTRTAATFRYSHIDRAPLGDMAATITSLILGNPGIDFVYTHIIDGAEFTLDTRELREGPADNSLADPVVLQRLAQSIRDTLNRLASNDGAFEPTEENNGKIDD
jgi:hypothetical protein